MQESKTYHLLREKIIRKTTIENTLALLERRFAAEAVRALIPALQSIVHGIVVRKKNLCKNLAKEEQPVKDETAFEQTLSHYIGYRHHHRHHSSPLANNLFLFFGIRVPPPR